MLNINVQISAFCIMTNIHRMVFVFSSLCIILLGYAAVTNGQDLTANYDALVSEMRDIRKQIRTGSTYIRWGRSTCDGDAQVVYRGHAAGAHTAVDGSGSNHLCLHESPQWMKYIDGLAFRAGVIYGLDYFIFADADVYSKHNHGGQSFHGFPVPCVVCFTQSRPTVLVIPARTECPSGWNFEYRGYISSQAHCEAHRRSEYICFDVAPETASGGVNHFHSLIYPTQVACGSLPCSRYITGRELTCVVCSR